MLNNFCIYIFMMVSSEHLNSSLDLWSFNYSISDVTFLSFWYSLPEILVLLFLFWNLLYLVSFFSKYSPYYVNYIQYKYIVKDLVLRVISLYCIFFSLIWTTYLASIFIFFSNPYFTNNFLFNGLWILDAYSEFNKFLVVSIFLITLNFCYDFVLYDVDVSLEFPILLGFSLFFSLILLSTFDFIMLFFVIEALTFIMCLLIVTDYTSKNSVEAAIKYFILSVLASSLALYAIIWVYGITKNTGFMEFKILIFNFNLIADQTFILTSLELPVIFLISSFLIKLGAFPFNIWVPDVYEGCPVLIMFYFMVSIKTILIFTLIRLLFWTFNIFYYIFYPILLIASLGSFIIGSLGAYSQTKLKRFFAYSSLNQLGFILLGLSNKFIWLSLGSTFLFIFVYLINNILFFSIFFQLRNSESYHLINDLSDLKGLSFFFPLESIYLSVALFSFIGLPPLAGFFSKFLLLVSAAKSGFFLEVGFALLTNILSAYYYLRVIKYLWLDYNDKYIALFIKTSTYYKNISVVIFVCVFFNLTFLFYIDSFLFLYDKILKMSFLGG